MASVNKIKELANAREYSLALEIVDSQDLSKSLNPQFLRLCGDIYSHAGRYKDARRVLVMAHRLAPESKRVVFSLIELHLNMGHEDLAKRYYDIYLFGSDDSIETKQAKYMYDNAHGEPAEKLIEYLESSYMHSMDYDWSFITYLLLIKLGRKSDAEALSDVYCATYKNSENSDCIGKIAAGDLEVDSLIYTYAKEWVDDNNEDENEVREQELKLIEDDELRIHPKEAEITIMFEEVGDGVEELSKRKMKKLIKEHEKQERELEEKEKMANEAAEPQDDEAANSDNKKTGLLKKLFKKSKSADEDLTEEIIIEHTDEEGGDKPEETEKTEKTEENEEALTTEEHTDTSEKSEMESGEVSDIKNVTLEEENVETSENITDTDSNVKVEAEIEATAETENDNIDNQTKKYKFNIEEVLLNDEPEQEDDGQLAETYTDDDRFQDNWEKDTLDDGETDMSKLHLKENETQSDLVISVDEENDGFAAEADTIDDLNGEADYNDTFNNTDSEKSETEKFFSKKKMEYVFEASDIIIDEDEDDEIDDFTIIEDDEFGSMSVEDDEEIETTSETDVEEKTEITSEIDVEKKTEITSEVDVEEKTEITSEVDAEDKTETISEPDVEEEIKDNTEEVDFEFDFEFDAEDEQEKNESETEENAVQAEEESINRNEDADFEFDFEFEVETEEEADQIEEVPLQTDEQETFAVKETEPYSEPDIEKEVEAETEVETEAEREEIETIYETDEKWESEIDSMQEQTDENTQKPDLLADIASRKSNLDFPVFKTDLFPEYNVVEVENNFDEIMEKAQDKMQANLLKEEQMQKEAEALLASLGIDYGSVTPKKQVEKAVHKPDNPINNTASRDALKASLKISSEKREILRKIKEHR
ncbi:MAG: hypothetical protein HDT40_08510 [Lachnospiraceae bacterium]|nr:hypothetical protein [Lachnospiraceae bacterium]